MRWRKRLRAWCPLLDARMWERSNRAAWVRPNHMRIRCSARWDHGGHGWDHGGHGDLPSIWIGQRNRVGIRPPFVVLRTIILLCKQHFSSGEADDEDTSQRSRDNNPFLSTLHADPPFVVLLILPLSERAVLRFTAVRESTASKNGSKHDNTSSGIAAQMLSFPNCTTKSFGS